MMTQDEQSEIIGRKVLEKTQLQQHLAIIDTQLKDLAAHLTTLAKEITDHIGPEPSLESIAINPVISKYADLSKVVRLVDERVTIYQHLQNVRRALTQMGV